MIFVSAVLQSTSRAGGLLARALLAAFAALLIAGCGGKSADVDPTINWNAERLYEDAK